jgi:hypothetical protein
VGLWHKAAGGVVPAYQRGSRWYVKAEDLPKTAKALGLKPLAPSSTQGR